MTAADFETDRTPLTMNNRSYGVFGGSSPYTSFTGGLNVGGVLMFVNEFHVGPSFMFFPRVYHAGNAFVNNMLSD